MKRDIEDQIEMTWIPQNKGTRMKKESTKTGTGKQGEKVTDPSSATTMTLYM